jgi:hypothetical protein
MARTATAQTVFRPGRRRQAPQLAFDNVIERLTGVRSERVQAQGVEFDLGTSPDNQQQLILKLMAGKQSSP